MGVSLYLPQDSVAKDQPLEEAESAFHAAIPNGHLQRTVTRRAPIGRGKTVAILAAPKGHASSPAGSRPS